MSNESATPDEFAAPNTGDGSTPPPPPPPPPAPSAPPAPWELAAGSPAGSLSKKPRRRLSRRVLAIGLVLLVVAGAAGAYVYTQQQAPSATVWQNITAGIQDGVVSKDTALEAFAYLYKVSIPGVSVPGGQDASDHPTSGTGALSWVQSHWSELTPDQQAVINRYTTPGANDTVVTFDATKTASSPLGLTLAAARNPGVARANFGNGAPAAITTAMENELKADIQRIGTKLGVPPIAYGSSLWTNVTLDLSDTDGGNTLFVTNGAVNGIGHYSPCNITAWKNSWQNESVTSNGGVSDTLHVLITHEVVHCYQNVVWGSVDLANAIPTWIKEGTALYLAADDTGIQEPMIPSMWTKGYLNAEIPLSNRSYDAFGYFSLLASKGRDLWGSMVAAWQAAANSATHSDAFIGVLGGDDPDIRNNWAETYLRNDSWGDPWVMPGKWIPDAAQVTQHPAQAQPDPGWIGDVLSRANTVLNVDGTSGEVVTIGTDGLASVHDQNGNSDIGFQAETFCTSDGGCKCPDGSELAGQTVATQKLTIPFVAAFNAPSGGSHYTIVGTKLDDICKKLATPQPQPKPQPTNSNPCGANCSKSNGDPHLLTVNDYKYDFQAAGEFTLLRSSDGSVEIQARQQPYGDTGRVAINTAIAAKVGTHRVGVYADSTGNLTLKIDGTAADLSGGPKDLGGGARVSTATKGFEIDLPDGTKLWTLSVGGWGINALISPSTDLAKGGSGLLGPIVPGGMGVPALPDGSRLPAANDPASRDKTLYSTFADAWRVTDSTTLFDYDEGKTTASYTVKPFPNPKSNPGTNALTADQAAAGSSACASITDTDLHLDCVYDVGVTGQAGFADTYTALVTFQDSGIAQGTPGPTVTEAPGSGGSPTTAPGLTGGWTVMNGLSIAGSAQGADDTVYANIQTGPSTYSLVALDPVNRTILAQVSVPAPTKVHFAMGSLWLEGLKTDSNGHNCNVTRFDATSLAELATIDIPCTFFGPQVISDQDNVWFVDVTKYDLTTQKGAVLTRIDPATNKPDPSSSVALPFINGYSQDGQGVLFYYDTTPDRGYYRLQFGATALEQIGKYVPGARLGGDGVWIPDNTAKTAGYFTTSGSAQATVQVGGPVVAGDKNNVYTEVLGNDASGQTNNQLWRFPSDGSTPVEINTSPSAPGGDFLSYGNGLVTANGDGVLALWTVHASNGQPATILLQWTPYR